MTLLLKHLFLIVTSVLTIHAFEPTFVTRSTAVSWTLQMSTENEVVTSLADNNNLLFQKVLALSKDDLEQRERDKSMFTAAVRRDIYNVLRNPLQPNEGAPAPLSWQSTIRKEEDVHFGAVLLAKPSTNFASKWEAYSFVTDQQIVKEDDSSSSSSVSIREESDYEILDDKQLMKAIAEMGSVNADSVAITKAFENWLEDMAKTHWGDNEVSKLSVDFLVAFGNELTERLGVNHRILSSELSEEEMQVLSQPPFCYHVDPELLETFQIQTIHVNEQIGLQPMGMDWATEKRIRKNAAYGTSYIAHTGNTSPYESYVNPDVFELESKQKQDTLWWDYEEEAE